VVEHLRYLASRSEEHASPSRPPVLNPTSFIVYLGEFATVPSSGQIAVLSGPDILIVDPLKSGVREAIQGPNIPSETQILGRLDLAPCLSGPMPTNVKSMIATVDRIVDAVDNSLAAPRGQRTFSGVVLAGWSSKVPLYLLAAVAELLEHCGLQSYLEIAPPEFLDDQNSPDLSKFSGVVVRNGTIMPNGERRDFFNMDKMKSTTKAFVSQSCLRPFTVMMWETVDDDVQLSHAVLRRSFMWCGYHGALVSVGTTEALTDATKVQPHLEPLSAFQWLKENRVMKLHESFRNGRNLEIPNFDNLGELESLAELLPAIRPYVEAMREFSSNGENINSSNASTLTVQNSSNGDFALQEVDGSPQFRQDWITHMDHIPSNPLDQSPSGSSYDGLGCFPLGLDVTQDDFSQILKSQQRLRKLNLLDRISSERIREMGSGIAKSIGSNSAWPEMAHFLRNSIRDFTQLTARCIGSKHLEDPLQLYVGLDSGFRTPTGAQFWAVYEVEARSGALVCYISKSALDLPRTLLHLYLSSRSFQRYHCFLAEYSLGQLIENQYHLKELPARMLQDLDLLSPTDLLLFLQHLRFSSWNETCPLLSGLEARARELLLDVPAYKQLKNLANFDYLDGKITDSELVEARINWYRHCFRVRIDIILAINMFREIDMEFQQILYGCRHDLLQKVTLVLEAALGQRSLDPYTDFVFFAIFCAARRAAFDEVYLEVSDRNPLFNEYSDQSAAFAELFALGSRCESYFDIVPSSFGMLLSNRHRKYYNQAENQPPMWIDNAPAFASAYAAAQTDIDPEQKDSVMPAYRRFTFLSVFAIPALVDIILLTFTGRGLYLTGFMETEIRWATLALMISLLLSGVVGTWISIGGTYYLISMAFSAANVFVLTRLIGGLAFTVAGGFIGFVVISAVKAPSHGAVFFFYLLGLTAYLSVLAALSSFQFPGSSFLNGRMVIICLIPLLIISPIITMWVPGYDPIIYLSVLYIFVFCLLIGIRWVGSRWVTWCYGIKTVDDAKVKAWYIQERASGQEESLAGMSEPAILALCRTHLYEAVQKERNRKFWQKSRADKLVQELAACWESTIFLLDWYCRLSDVKRPIPYSSTWNLETQVARDSLVQNQKGIKLHNSFIHWRNAGDEVGCGILYFLVALMDRWVSLLYGNPVVGLLNTIQLSGKEADSSSNVFRIAVGFGLAYYLVGAVLLDYKAQHLHHMAQKSSPISIRAVKYIQIALINDAQFKQKLYWTTLFKFLGVHVWALAVSAAFVWVFDSSNSHSGEALIIFLGYIAGYSGLLLYQYNKIFSGPHALKPLLLAVIVGLPTGTILKGLRPHYLWNDIITLNAATWTAALLSFQTAKLSIPRRIKPFPTRKKREFHSYGGMGVDHQWSHSELEAFYDALSVRPKEERFTISAKEHPGLEIKSLLLSCTHQTLTQNALNAFPTAPYWAQRIVSTWEDGAISIELISMRSVVKPEADIRAISCYSDGHMHLMVASDTDGSIGMHNITSNCQVISETLLHACAETILGLDHEQAGIAESILVCKSDNYEDFQVSECIKRAMPFEFSESRMAAFAVNSRKDILRNLCLGIDVETMWDDLPLDIRTVFLERCLGDATSFTADHLSWILSNVQAEPGCPVDTRIARYDLGALLAARKYHYFRSQGPLALTEKSYQARTADINYYQDNGLNVSVRSLIYSMWAAAKRPFTSFYHDVGLCIKFFVLACIADPEYHRELACMFQGKPWFVTKPSTFILTLLWRYSRAAQSLVMPYFLFKGRKELQTIFKAVKGTQITLKKNRVILQHLEGTSTAFIHNNAEGGFKLYFYSGTHKQEPASGATMVSTYSQDMRLRSRIEYSNGELLNEYLYDYPSDKKNKRLSKFTHNGNRRIPLSRSCVSGKKEGSVVHFNLKGYIESGSYMLDGNLVRFKYHYRKNAKYDDELLRAEFVLPHLSANVSWCAPPVRHPEKMERWIPHSRVQEATFVQGADVFECAWLYDHKFHPTITTKLNGQIIDTPPMIRYDWLGVLKKPSGSAFIEDNPLLEFRSVSTNVISTLFGTNVRRLIISTSRARSQLWKAWKKRNDIDGVVVRWLDERLLRSDPLLKPYWRYRNGGRLLRAEDYLALHADAVMASAELSTDISAWTPLAIRISDLFSFGQGGDAVIYTRTKALQPDNDNTLHVIAVDTGTWPNEGGGVSACRRDLINNLRTIRWHMVVESANDFGLPKHQTEENVESLKVIPLWGLDFLHPQHGMFTNKLDSEVDHLFKQATIDDIKRNFIPTLTALVRGSRAQTMTQADLKQATRALVNLNTYFEDSRHWKEVWTSDIVKQAWRELWLADDMPNAKAPSEWFNTELPTLGHLETALDLWFRYLFIFSIPIPQQVPAVFQASHHSVSAAYGIVCKIKRNCTLQIWDHAISWRETNLYLSSALCTMPPFIRNALLGLMKLTSTLILHHADQVLPCAGEFR
jgi:hypothetical protein